MAQTPSSSAARQQDAEASAILGQIRACIAQADNLARPAEAVLDDVASLLDRRRRAPPAPGQTV